MQPEFLAIDLSTLLWLERGQKIIRIYNPNLNEDSRLLLIVLKVIRKFYEQVSFVVSKTEMINV